MTSLRNRMPIPFACLLLASHVLCAPAMAAGKFVDRVFTDAAGKHKYVVYLPDGYTTQKKWPVVMFLHGAGERGTDGKLQTNVGLGAVLRQSKQSFPIVAVFPQCEDTKGRFLTGWLAKTADAQRAMKILADVEKDYSINTKQRVLTGWSMGGYGVWSIAAAYPDHWSAIVPVAGGGDPKRASKLKDLPTWAFHGADDRAVKASESQIIVAAIRKVGGSPRLTIAKNTGHKVWKTVYANPKLIAWMQDPNGNAAPAELLVRPGQRPIKNPSEAAPFVPALEITNAAYVRLGNEALNAMSYSVPSMVPKNLLVGRINDINDSTTASERTFSIQFTGIQYSGTIGRAAITAVGKDRLRFQLGLQNVNLSINRTFVTGRSRSAVAGPISVVIGYRGPVWLSVDVAPYVKNRKLRLKLLSQHFNIPDENWYVTSPAGVSTRGFGMTREKVSNGLVSGLYGQKARIEAEVRALVPNVVKQLEKQFEIKDTSEFVKGFWPLPVYRPRVRVWPQSVKTDKNGVTVVLGLTVAAVDPKNAPVRLRSVAMAAATTPEFASGKKLQVGLAPGVLEPMMQLMIDSGVSRIHVRDIPEKKFAALGDFQEIAKAIPDIKRFGDNVEIWSELVLSKPLAILENPSGTAPSAKTKTAADEQLTVEAPEFAISMAIKTAAAAKWTPYAEFRFKMSHAAGVSVVRPNFTSRTVRLNWQGDPQFQVSGGFAPGYQPQNEKIDADKIQQLFAAGWKAWTGDGKAANIDVPDLDFGISTLRLNRVLWASGFLSVELDSPGLKITNSTAKPLVYATKGPRSGWGRPITLAPNDSHTFPISYAVTFRSTTGGRNMLFTLPAGSHSEFRAPDAGGAPFLFQARPKPKPVKKPAAKSKKKSIAEATKKS